MSIEEGISSIGGDVNRAIKWSAKLKKMQKKSGFGQSEPATNVEDLKELDYFPLCLSDKLNLHSCPRL